ncbi:MAG: hypothetical protein HYU64_07120 [Armatimonadetes bacterium]|nr:hypothetical protein [Armatimonadota bacterium]
MDYLSFPVNGAFGSIQNRGFRGPYTGAQPLDPTPTYNTGYSGIYGISQNQGLSDPYTYVRPPDPTQTDNAGSNPVESVVVSPLAQKGREGFTYNVVDAYLGNLPPGALQNSEKARNALLDPNIPEGRRKILSDALRSIPGDHLTMLNMDGIKIQVEDKGKHYAHYKKKDSAIYVSDRMMKDLEDPARSKDAESVLRHEIGHALIDSIILREGGAASSFTSYLDSPPATEPGAQRRGVVEQATRRNKGQIRVDDAVEEKLADTYADLFSPYSEERSRLGSKDSQEIQLWTQTLSRGYQAGKEKPISPIVKDYKEIPGYKQAVSWGEKFNQLVGQVRNNGWASSLALGGYFEDHYKQLHQYYQNYAQLADLDDDPWGHWR